MKKILLCCLFALSLLAGWPAHAAEKPTPEEMMTMLKVSGSVDTLDQIMNQLVANLELQVRQNKPNLPHEAYFIIEDEFKAGMKEWAKVIFINQMEYYSNHLTRPEVLELTRMYQSEAYKNMIKLNKSYIAQKLQPLMQKDVPVVTQQIIERINQRMIKEGVIKNAEAGI